MLFKGLSRDFDAYVVPMQPEKTGSEQAKPARQRAFWVFTWTAMVLGLTISLGALGWGVYLAMYSVNWQTLDATPATAGMTISLMLGGTLAWAIVRGPTARALRYKYKHKLRANIIQCKHDMRWQMLVSAINDAVLYKNILTELASRKSDIGDSLRESVTTYCAGTAKLNRSLWRQPIAAHAYQAGLKQLEQTAKECKDDLLRIIHNKQQLILDAKNAAMAKTTAEVEAAIEEAQGLFKPHTTP